MRDTEIEQRVEYTFNATRARQFLSAIEQNQPIEPANNWNRDTLLQLAAACISAAGMAKPGRNVEQAEAADEFNGMITRCWADMTATIAHRKYSFGEIQRFAVTEWRNLLAVRLIDC